jgi:hypothetical protein
MSGLEWGLVALIAAVIAWRQVRVAPRGRDCGADTDKAVKP